MAAEWWDSPTGIKQHFYQVSGETYQPFTSSPVLHFAHNVSYVHSWWSGSYKFEGNQNAGVARDEIEFDTAGLALLKGSAKEEGGIYCTVEGSNQDI